MSASHLPNDTTIQLETTELVNRLRRGELPTATAPDSLAPGDECHYVTPVRFGRRRADQYGHLILTRGWLKFRGTMDLSVTWSEVADVQRVACEIVVSLQDSGRLLRFSSHSDGEAARGVLLAQHLTQSARPHTADLEPAFQHATL
jgi:hypothetical protein